MLLDVVACCMLLRVAIAAGYDVAVDVVVAYVATVKVIHSYSKQRLMQKPYRCHLLILSTYAQ